MYPTKEASGPADIDILPVEHLSEYVAGFPVHVAITLRAHRDISFNALQFADFLNMRSCIGAEIVSLRGGEPRRYKPKPILALQAGKSGGKLGPGELRRMLVDVSPYFAGIAEGEYRVRFSFVETYGVYEAPPVTMRFRSPAPVESALLAAAAPDRENFETWDAWTIACAEAAYDGPIASDNPLKFNLLLRRLFCGPGSLDQFDPAALGVLTGLYAPEGRALQAELYQARGDTDRYLHVRGRILVDTPGLGWWIRMIDRGGAFIKSIRLVP
jgi:hypothetical protein